MTTYEELLKIKYGDYIELKHYNDLMLGKVIHLQDSQISVRQNKIIFITIVPKLEELNRIPLSFEHLISYFIRIVDSPREKRLIKLLYE